MSMLQHKWLQNFSEIRVGVMGYLSKVVLGREKTMSSFVDLIQRTPQMRIHILLEVIFSHIHFQFFRYLPNLSPLREF